MWCDDSIDHETGKEDDDDEDLRDDNFECKKVDEDNNIVRLSKRRTCPWRMQWKRDRQKSDGGSGKSCSIKKPRNQSQRMVSLEQPITTSSVS